MMIAILELGFLSYRRPLTRIILQSKRQVHSCSYLLFNFSKLLANIHVVLLLHFKSKRLCLHNYYEVVVSTGMVVALGWWVVGPWYKYGGGPTATGKFTLD
jgi:hypothetical protein